MWIMVATLLIMIGCAYAQYRNALFSSIAMLFMVLIAGLVAFGFWEPIADQLDPVFQNSALAGCEDMIALVLLFGLTLFLLRLAMTYLNSEMIEQHGHLQQLGALVVGLVLGYFLSGFLICAVQTLPLDVNFFDFEPRETNEPVYRAYYPPDRVWLALMRQESAGAFSWKDEPAPKGDTNADRYVTFDRQGTFELRYLRYRRNTDARGPLPYFGELDIELKGKKQR